MNRAIRGRATLVVIEFGASWPSWLELGGAASGNMAVVAQHYEGHPSELLTQVASRISRLENAGWQLERVVMVSNGRVDRDAETSRRVLCRGLLARVEAMGLGQLILTYGSTDDHRVERGLERLVSGLERDKASAKIGIGLRVPPPKRPRSALVLAS
jgi:hypothetical protein